MITKETKNNLLVILSGELDKLPIPSSDNLSITSVSYDQLHDIKQLIVSSPDLIIIHIPSDSDFIAEQILLQLKPYIVVAHTFILGKKMNKEKLYAINKNIFFWENDSGHLTYETIIQLIKSEETKIKLQEDNKSMKEKLDVSSIMIQELEQTNNNLISATWRERDLKKKLSATIDELNQTKAIVEAQHKRISASINYALRIQLAINAAESDVLEDFSDSFFFYKPKDVISGDFPWYYKKNNKIFIGAVDCTGHGVPGAMLSMIGNLLLNDIVNEDENKLPSAILLEMHHAVIKTLKQDKLDSNSNDGMDMGICVIDKSKNEIIFSGAHRPLLYVSGDEINLIRGDKFPIGGLHYRGKNKYTDVRISYKQGDMFFLFSDGLTDQIGGDAKRKLTVAGLIEVIKENMYHTGKIQKLKFELFFHEWLGEEKQLDDVLLIGVRLD